MEYLTRTQLTEFGEPRDRTGCVNSIMDQIVVGLQSKLGLIDHLRDPSRRVEMGRYSELIGDLEQLGSLDFQGSRQSQMGGEVLTKKSVKHLGGGIVVVDMSLEVVMLDSAPDGTIRVLLEVDHKNIEPVSFFYLPPDIRRSKLSGIFEILNNEGDYVLLYDDEEFTIGDVRSRNPICANYYSKNGRSKRIVFTDIGRYNQEVILFHDPNMDLLASGNNGY